MAYFEIYSQLKSYVIFFCHFVAPSKHVIISPLAFSGFSLSVIDSSFVDSESFILNKFNSEFESSSNKINELGLILIESSSSSI